MSEISLDIEIEESDFFQSMKFHGKMIYQKYVEFREKLFQDLIGEFQILHFPVGFLLLSLSLFTNF